MSAKESKIKRELDKWLANAPKVDAEIAASQERIAAGLRRIDKNLARIGKA